MEVVLLLLVAMQSRIALIESDACKLALKKLDQELVPPAGYNAAAHMHAAAAAVADSAAGAVDADVGPGAADCGDDGVRLPPATVEQLQRLLVEVCEMLAASRLDSVTEKDGVSCPHCLYCYAAVECSHPVWLATRHEHEARETEAII
jgi:hypothetical protein